MASLRVAHSFGFKLGQVRIIPMLALVPWGVEGESVTGCCAVTFYNLLIIIKLSGARRTVHFTGPSDQLRNLRAMQLVSLTKDSNLLRELAAEYARPGSTGLLDRNAAEGRFSGFLDLLFAFAVTAPVGLREAYLHRLPKLVKILRRECVRSTECQCTVKQRLLNLD